MPERLVDVSGKRGVLHTFPILIEGEATDAEFKAKALQAAAHAELVPPKNLDTLASQMHNGRGGPLEPYGDHRSVLCETRAGLEQSIRESAYFLWLSGGCLQGKADEYWHLAHQQHLRIRAYVRWQQEGCPENRADENWRSVCAFER